MRSLSPDEAALWARVTATIRPLSRDRRRSQAAEQCSRNRSAVEAGGRPRSALRGAAAAAAPAAHARNDARRELGPAAAPGAVEPDRILDLHGMNLDRAWAAIDRGARAGDRARRPRRAADHRPPSAGRAAGRARQDPRRGPRLARGIAPRRLDRRGPRRPPASWRRRQPVPRPAGADDAFLTPIRLTRVRQADIAVARGASSE